MSAAKATSKRKIRLKNLKEHQTIWHPESTLVYKSRKERVVIGRYVDDELIPLDDEALELCEEWNMKPDESLLESRSSPDEDEKSGADEDDNGEDGEEDGGEDGGEDEEGNNDDEQSDKKETVHEPEVKDSEPTAPLQSSDESLQQIMDEYASYSKSFLSKLLDVNNEKDSKFSAKEQECEQLKSELEDLQAKYDVIKKKFDTMKSLFA